jgi:nitrous oxidase accessory protein NosD
MPTPTRSLYRLSIAFMLGLGLTAIVLLGLLATRAQSSAMGPPLSSHTKTEYSTGIITAVGRHLERDGVPFKVRGVNYYPKDYGWERFWISYTEALPQINRELNLAKALGVNTVRIFLPYKYFDGSDQDHLNHLKGFVNRLQLRDMTVIVTLFDLYTDVYTDPYSAQHDLADKKHISAVINTLGTTNTAVLAWDIKNEIDRDYPVHGEDQVRAWARRMISYTRQLDPNHLITIGFYGAITGTPCYDTAITDTLVYSPDIVAEFTPAVDFVSMHYFLSERRFENDLQVLRSLIGDKPLVLEEFGLHTLATPTIPCTTHFATELNDPRCDDSHTETEQAAYYNGLLSASEAHDVAGHLFWTLNDFSHILTDSQESRHCQGILRNSGVTVCQVTSPRDYAKKPAADTVCRHYDDRVAYLDLFDAWVDSNTDKAPPGWSDNLDEGGALLRGHNPSQPLWSHDPGKVAFSKWGTSVTGLAFSPMLTNVDVDRYPILAGQVYSYSIRDTENGGDASLHIGIQEGSRITRLLTFTSGLDIPHSFRVDLRRPPLNWSSTHDFIITFELEPEVEDGYSATYEIDWIGLQSTIRDAVTTPLAIPLDIRDTFGPRLLQPEGHSRYDFHRGIDWPADEYTPVRAVTTGTVRSFRDDWESGTGSGNFVLLSHKDTGSNSYETRYNHLVAVHCAITNGLQVNPGQVIGWVGQTGARYDHLHFEVLRGLTVTQRAAIHPLSTHFLPWTNIETPTVNLLGVYTDATGLTALIRATSPYTEPDVTAVGASVSGPVTDERTIDYVALSANTTVVANLDDPLVNDVCIIPTDLTGTNGYSVTMAFRRLDHDQTAVVTAQVTDVGGWSTTTTTHLVGGLEMMPPEQEAKGIPGETVTFVYTLTSHTGDSDTFKLTHLSAQGWPATITPETSELGDGKSTVVTVVIALNTNRFGPPDCGLLLAEGQNGTRPVVAGFYRIYRDAYVSATTGKDIPDAGSMITPFATIGYAISQTDAGGTIHVAQGTYTENLTLTRTINLLGGYTEDWAWPDFAPYSTTVDGAAKDTVLLIDGDHGPLVEGFTLFNGHRRGGAGGGVRLIGGAAPTLRSNWILSNTSEKCGGGIYVGPYGALPPTIINNSVAANKSVSSSGGGICIEERMAFIQGNDILDNEAANYGGGIYVRASPALIQANVISGNRATGNDGGGLYLTGNTKARVVNNLIRYNRASRYGNGIKVTGPSAPCICNNTLVANHPESGAGLYSGTGSSPTVTNNIVADHEIGVHCSSPVTISFSVLSNTTDLASSNCISSNNIIADPKLIDEVHLACDSPAIDAGRITSYTPSTDIDGHPRPLDGDCDGVSIVDIGAAEYYGCVYLPIVLKDFADSFRYDVTGCLRPAATHDHHVEIYVENNDIVVHHYNAIYNCCAVIVVDLVDERPLLKLVESETFPGPPCDCMCPYNINARIPDLPSGNYRVEVWNASQSLCYGRAEVEIP